MSRCSSFFFFFFNDTATTEIYTLSLHDALPIYRHRHSAPRILGPSTGPLDARSLGRGCAAPVRESRGQTMDLGLLGKTAVVTGSTAGIGLAIATALAEEGAAVVVNGRTDARVSSAVDRIRRRAGSADARGVAADLGTASGVEAFVRQVPEADVLVNNLGIFEAKPFAEISDADWRRFFEVNVLSGVRLTRQYLPAMLRKHWGRGIFISCESAQQIPAGMIHYGITKTAPVAIARGLAGAEAGTGVTVNSVLVGPTA